MLGAFSDFLDFTLGQPTLGPDCKRKRADAAIAAFTHLLAEISPPPEEGVDHFGTQAQRDARADRVDAAARAYALALTKAGVTESARKTAYFHIITCHLGEQVRKFGSLFAWSGEGLEHFNFMIKKVQRGNCQRGKEPGHNGGKAGVREAPGRVGQALLWAYIATEAGGRDKQRQRKRGRALAARNAEEGA